MYIKAGVESFEESKFVFYKQFSAHVLSAVSNVGPLEIMWLSFGKVFLAVPSESLRKNVGAHPIDFKV